MILWLHGEFFAIVYQLITAVTFLPRYSRPDKGPELGNLGDKQYHRSLCPNDMLDG